MYRVQKKRHFGWLWILLFACAFLVGIGIGFLSVARERAENTPPITLEEQSQRPAPPQDQPTSAQPEETDEPEETEKEPAMRYFVAEEGGAVCVFTVDAEGVRRFSHKLPIEIESLKEADRKLFVRGFFVDSKQALLELMEDFAS